MPFFKGVKLTINSTKPCVGGQPIPFPSQAQTLQTAFCDQRRCPSGRSGSRISLAPIRDPTRHLTLKRRSRNRRLRNLWPFLVRIYLPPFLGAYSSECKDVSIEVLHRNSQLLDNLWKATFYYWKMIIISQYHPD